MKIGRGNRSTRRKPAPAPVCPPQIPHDQTRARTPGRLDGKPATNLLSYGATLDGCLMQNILIETVERVHNPVRFDIDKYEGRLKWKQNRK
jgi:hypothetical protein